MYTESEIEGQSAQEHLVQRVKILLGTHHPVLIFECSSVLHWCC